MKSVLTLMAGAAIIISLHTAAMAKDLVVGVSWSNFQEERWEDRRSRNQDSTRSIRRQVYFR